jgi:hypothetical protein
MILHGCSERLCPSFLLSVQCYLSVRVWVYGRVGEALLGAWLCGLALANQHAALLFLVRATTSPPPHSSTALSSLYLFSADPLLCPAMLQWCQVVLCPGVLTALLLAPSSPQRPQRSSLATAGLLLSLGICFLLGLSPYAYLYSSATNGPTPGSWGDLTSWRGLVRHVLRQEYGTFKVRRKEERERWGAREWGWSGDVLLSPGVATRFPY